MTRNRENGEKTILRRLYEDAVFFVQTIIFPFLNRQQYRELYDYQKEFLRSKSKRIVGIYGRQSGKTTVAALKAIHFVYTRPNVTVLIVSKGLRQSMIMFQVISNFILGNPILRKSVARYTHTQIQLKNGSKVIALPCSSDGANLRGFTAHMVIADEAAFMPETVITNVIMPMLSTTDGTLILLSTPWGRNHVFYRCVMNPKYWVQHIPSTKCPKISKQFLEEQRRELGELRFNIEYMAQFIEDATAFFSQDLIRPAIDADYHILTDEEVLKAPEKKWFDGQYFLGADFGKRVDYSVVYLVRKVRQKVIEENSGRATRTVYPAYRTIYFKQFPLRTRLTDVCSWIEMLFNKFQISNACVDQTTMGEMLVERLKESCMNIEGIVFEPRKKQDVMMHLYTMFEQERVIIPFDRELLAQINEQQYSFSRVRTRKTTEIYPEEKGVIVFYHPEGRHDDILMALALAIYAARDVRTSKLKVY